MSTVAKGTDAAASVSATPATPARKAARGGGVKVALGSAALLAAIALIGAAVAGVVGLEGNRDGTGYFVTHTHHYETPSYALSTETLDIGGVTGALEAGLVRLRIAATATGASRAIFVGLARTEDADRYLARVEHDELRDISFDPFKVDYRRLGAGAPRALPATQGIWKEQASGTGTQTINWPVAKGRWTAVVMNADGSRSVRVDAQIAAHLAGVWWFVAGGFALGALFLAGGAALVRAGIRRHAPKPASGAGAQV